MADFELIDTKRFLQSSKGPSKTSETLTSVKDGKTYACSHASTNQQNLREAPKDSLGGVLLDEAMKAQHRSIAARDAQRGSAGLAGPTEVSEKIKEIEIASLENSLPRLPFALERLVSAASSNLLTGFTFDGVPDINRYVMAWALTSWATVPRRLTG